MKEFILVAFVVATVSILTSTTTSFFTHAWSFQSMYNNYSPLRRQELKRSTHTTLLLFANANEKETAYRMDRHDFLRQLFLSTVTVSTMVGTPTPSSITHAKGDIPSPTTTPTPKLVHISDSDMANILRSDVVDKAFLATADLTREIYDERAMFTDEIDTYPLEKWIQGTKKLFVGEKSRVRLVGDVQVTPREAKFRFDEDLMFRIPLLNPVVTLSGVVVLQRDPETGLITSYREYWDQDVATVLKSATLFH